MKGTFLIVQLALLHGLCIAATLRATTRSGVSLAGPNRTLRLCACSASTRGYPDRSDATIANLTTAYNAYYSSKFRDLVTTSRLGVELRNAFNAVIQKHALEGAVNYDAAMLRLRGGPGVCHYQRNTGLSTLENSEEPAASCHSTQYGATDLQRASFVEKGKLLTKIRAPPGVIIERTEKGKTLPRNEGCVAVEHLVGHQLQHANHWWRNVLCAHGFCATPNHAIVVDGEWTSMWKMCSVKWTCNEEMRFVNNLKISGVRRVRYDEHIIITPYDIRVPRWISWTVQMMEDVFTIISFAVRVGFALAVAVYSSAKLVGSGDQLTKNRVKSKKHVRFSIDGNKHCAFESRAPTERTLSFPPAVPC